MGAEFSPDGAKILTWSGNIRGKGDLRSEARIWNGTNGTPLGRSMQHEWDAASNASFVLGVIKPGSHARPVEWRNQGTGWKFSFDAVTGIRGMPLALSLVGDGDARAYDLTTRASRFISIDAASPPRPQMMAVFDAPSAVWRLRKRPPEEFRVLFQQFESGAPLAVAFLPDSNKFPWDHIGRVGSRNGVVMLDTPAGLVDLATRRLYPGVRFEADLSPAASAEMQQWAASQWGEVQEFRQDGSTWWVLYARRLVAFRE